MKKKLCAMVLALCMLLTLAAGCGTQTESKTSVAESTETSQTAETTAAPQEETETPAEQPSSEETTEGSAVEEAPATVEYPLVTDGSVSFDVFMSMAGFIPMVIPDVANVGFDTTRGVQQLEEQTGVDLKWTLIDADSYADQFSIVMASGDYPDFLGAANTMVTGGIDALVEQEICIDVVPYLDSCLPDFKAGLYSENEDYRKYITSDSGYITTIYNFEEQSTMGSYIRQDWLDQLGLAVPETYDELHDVLAAFKSEIDGCDYPMLMTQTWDFPNNMFVGGYETSSFGTGADLAYFVQDGKVQAGVMSDGYRDYIQMCHDWYAEGLIGEPTLNVVNNMQINEYLLSNQCGFGNGQSDTLGTGAVAAAGGSYNMRAVKEMVREKGDTFKLYKNAGQPGNGGWAVSTACEEPEIALKVINWMWTEEGYNAMNFGVEGETYNIVDGEVVFTDLIVNNPNGMNAMFNSCSEISFFDLPFDFCMERKVATLSNEAEAEAQEIWRTNTSDEMRYFGSLTIEESEAYTSMAGDLYTHAAENISKFVTGTRPMSEWDSFLDDLRSMKIDECIALKQAAYDRYQQR